MRIELAESPNLSTSQEHPTRPMPPPRDNTVGRVSLLVALSGTVLCHVVLALGIFPHKTWLSIIAAGFEAALVGGLADWFAVTALFRHPLGLPIPHTAIIPTRRTKIIESISSIIQEEWLSPAVIRARLARTSSSALLVDWLRDPERLTRFTSPARDIVSHLARILAEDDFVEFVDHTLREQLHERPLAASLGPWLRRFVSSKRADLGFAAVTRSLANFFARPDVAKGLYWCLNRLAHTLHNEGQRLLAFFLRRPTVQQKIMEALLNYATTELRNASNDANHPWRISGREAVCRFADQLTAGDPHALVQAQHLQEMLIESVEAAPLVRTILARVAHELERDLADPTSAISTFIERTLRKSVLELFENPERCVRFDQWVQSTASDLVQRHHHEIGLTVRENLEALETGELVAQIEARIGADLQFIRLNGAVVGGLIGLLLGILHWLAP